VNTAKETTLAARDEYLDGLVRQIGAGEIDYRTAKRLLRQFDARRRLAELVARRRQISRAAWAALQRSRDLAERAARLRAAAPPRTAVQNCAGGASGPRVDTLDLEAGRPRQGLPGGFNGA